MHTVFINTTERIIDIHPGFGNDGGSGLDLLNCELELKKLKYVHCPLKNWNDERVGYKNAVREVSIYIDTYSNVGNDFNLIVYADLREVARYMGLSLENDDAPIKGAIRATYTEMVTNLFTKTVYQCFVDAQRAPASKFLLILEQPDYRMPEYIMQVNGMQPSLFTQARKEVVLNLLGFVPYKEFVNKAAELREAGKSDSFDVLMSKNSPGANFSFKEVYAKEIQTFIKGIVLEETVIDHMIIDFCDTITNTFNSECLNYVGVSEYYTNRSVLNTNLSVNKKSNFLLQCFIWDCVNTNTLFNVEKEQDTEVKVPKKIPNVSDEQWEDICTLLATKKKKLTLLRAQLDNDRTGYVNAGLVPPIYTVNYKKFGLDENGRALVKTKERSPDPADTKKKDKKRKKRNKGTDPELDGEIEKKRIESEAKEQCEAAWIDGKNYDFFVDATDQNAPEVPTPTNIDEYITSAENLETSAKSIDVVLRNRLNGNMSHYSAPSDNNKTPILKRRKVCSEDDNLSYAQNDYGYAVRDGSGNPQINDDLGSVSDENVMEAYNNVMIGYLDYDTSRGIEITDIKDESEKFKNKVKEIKASMAQRKKICGIAAATFGALFGIPLLASQWVNVFANIFTPMIALSSAVIPAISIGIGYQLAKDKQNRDLEDAWEELKDAYNKANEANHKSIRSYDDLMTRYIPSLKYIYEYVIDFDFHNDCFKTLRSRVSHHKSVLKKTGDSIEAFLRHLDFNDNGIAPPTLKEEDYVDSSISPYEGDNYARYSIIDKDIINAIYK